MTTHPKHASVRGLRTLAHVGGAALALALSACDSNSKQRIPSLFHSDPAAAGDTNSTNGGYDSDSVATGGPPEADRTYHAGPGAPASPTRRR